MVSLRAARLILTVIAVLFIGGCAASPPPLPADPAAVRAALSTPDFLPGITTAQWPDGGRSAADALSWIATDATSENDEKATAAGQSAHAVASYLAQQQLELAHIPTGPFNLRKKSLGALNPQLTQGFAHILEPFQPNLVGDATRTRGFDPLDATANDHAAARRVFAVLDTDTAAGTAFFAGKVGGTTPLASLTVNGPGGAVVAADVRTTGPQTYDSAVEVPGPTREVVREFMEDYAAAVERLGATLAD